MLSVTCVELRERLREGLAGSAMVSIWPVVEFDVVDQLTMFPSLMSHVSGASPGDSSVKMVEGEDGSAEEEVGKARAWPDACVSMVTRGLTEFSRWIMSGLRASAASFRRKSELLEEDSPCPAKAKFSHRLFLLGLQFIHRCPFFTHVQLLHLPLSQHMQHLKGIMRPCASARTLELGELGLSGDETPPSRSISKTGAV